MAAMNDETENLLECAICLQHCMQPIQLPCSHVFCFLCAKGTALQSRTCALCRAAIPNDFISKPFLFKKVNSESDINTERSTPRYVWFYEGYNGWWQYDERTCNEIEAAYADNAESVDVLIAGSVYVIDFESLVQYQRHRSSRKRKIKRDLTTADKKGVAGLQSNAPTGQKTVSSSGDNRNTSAGSSATSTSAGSSTDDAFTSASVTTFPRQLPLGESDHSRAATSGVGNQLFSSAPLQRSSTAPVHAFQADSGNDVVGLTRRLSLQPSADDQHQ